MSDPFSFDPAKLTDDELMNRQMDLQRRIVWCSRFSTGEAVEQLQVMLAAVEFERRERFFNLQQALFNAQFPAVIETEPDLKEEPAKETRKPSNKHQVTKRAAMVRTSRPTNDADGVSKDEK